MLRVVLTTSWLRAAALGVCTLVDDSAGQWLAWVLEGTFLGALYWQLDSLCLWTT